MSTDPVHPVTGPMTFDGVPGLLADTLPRVQRAQGRITFDLAGVTRVDSAALALIVEWLRCGASRGVAVHLKNVPAALRDLARVCDGDELLPELATP